MTLPGIIEGLPLDLAQFVRQQVSDGHFPTETEVVTHGLRLLQERAKTLNDLRCEVLPAFEGLDKGEGIDLKDNDALKAFMDDVRRRGDERLAARRQSQ